MKATKNPNDVKKGLECCSSEEMFCSPEDPKCSYDCGDEQCIYNLMHDALALIQQLEAQNAELSGKIGRLQAERDAAVEALKNGDVCEACKHFGTLMDEEPCASCSILHSNFEWRGVTKEE